MISNIHTYIFTNGEVESYTEKGIKIRELSGKLPIIHKLVALISASYRREWYTEMYGEPRTPGITFYMGIVSKDGHKDEIHQLLYEQVKELSKYIKKK